MPYKRTITGKDKLTGRIEQAVERYRAWYRADFLPESAELPFTNYLCAMTEMLAKWYEHSWPAGPEKQELVARHMAYDRIFARPNAFEDEGLINHAVYELLDYLVENISPEKLSSMEPQIRQRLSEDRNQIWEFL